MLETQPNTEPIKYPDILKYFDAPSGMDGLLNQVYDAYYSLAMSIVYGGAHYAMNKLLDNPLPSGPEQTVALRKLLESRDAAVRCIQGY